MNTDHASLKGVVESKTKDLKGTINKGAKELTGAVNIAKGGGITDYNQMKNKPQIDGVELIGNRSIEEIGVREISGQDLLNIFDEIWR